MCDQQMKDLLISGAASKIYNELKKLTSSSIEDQERFRKRWIWELIQNASDCCRFGEKIDIEVNFVENSRLAFSHNGRGFSKDNLLSIVTQFSNKITEEDSMGKFGTGFISTALISPNIIIDSFLEDTKQNFSLKLDRSGESIETLRNSIDENLRIIENLNNRDNVSQLATNRTIFSYDLASLVKKEGAIKAINEGIVSLENHVIYLLAFNDRISSIKCNGKKYSVKNRESSTTEPALSLIDIIEEQTQEVTSLVAFDFEDGTIAAPFKRGERFLKIDSCSSRLFCNFPLVGTEDYPFPIILNSSKFNVEVDRDGIFESDLENIRIIDNSIKAYDRLLQLFCSKSEFELFNICGFERIQKTNYKKNLSRRLDSIIFNKELVLTNSGKMMSIWDSNEQKQIFVPKENTEGFEYQVWDLFSGIPSINIPIAEFSEGWRAIIENDITVSNIQNNYLKDSTIEKFKAWFGNEDAIKWLNNYYQYLANLGDKFTKNIVLPNAYGEFRSFKEIYLVDSVISELLAIYLSINPELDKNIIYSGVVIPNEFRSQMSFYSSEKIAEVIESHVHTLLSKEGKKNRTTATEKIFSDMLELFSQSSGDWNILFPTLYSDRAKLRSQQFNEELNKLGDVLAEKNLTIESVSSIISDDKLLNVLLTSPEDLPEEVVKQLQHISKSSFYGKKKIDQMIERSTENVYNYLQKNGKYEVPDTFEEWNARKLSTTVFKATKDGNIDLLIVIRPSDEDRVIFYEEQELSALDSNKYELWTDNGEKIRQLTLGDILKTTNITVLPLKNLFSEEVDD